MKKTTDVKLTMQWNLDIKPEDAPTEIKPGSNVLSVQTARELPRSGFEEDLQAMPRDWRPRDTRARTDGREKIFY